MEAAEVTYSSSYSNSATVCIIYNQLCLFLQAESRIVNRLSTLYVVL